MVHSNGMYRLRLSTLIVRTPILPYSTNSGRSRVVDGMVDGWPRGRDPAVRRAPGSMVAARPRAPSRLAEPRVLEPKPQVDSYSLRG